VEWLGRETDVESVTEALPQHLHQYQLALCHAPEKDDGRMLSVSTQAKALAAVKTWFEWMVAEQLLAFNPASGLRMPKVPRSLPRNVLTQEEARMLLESTPIEEPRDVRDRAMLEVLYGSGVRREELLSLTIYDADLVQGSLRIELGKGRQTRIVPLTQSAIAALKLYLEEARPRWASEAGKTTLFVSSRSGRALSDNDLLLVFYSNPQKWNKYVYVLNNPLRYIDPDGLAEILLWGSLNEELKQDLLKRGVNKEIWNGWNNEQRQTALNARALLISLDVWNHITSLAFSKFEIKQNVTL
jgi:site-specific recombinase XerC